ncbi:MAG: NTP transferase domain-containing protein [Candidatus Methanoperedens sp.]|nr:NTP transferase domain-containing protein [Candidatus Methanoperedens sp.]MCE8427636.1 NTP transferase domain-containing protein [Candidatus Methanoperedens sp.]
MDAVLMAGGMGKRLGKDEKPLTILQGKPMIQYVLFALLRSKNIGRIFVAASPKVEKTTRWLLDFKNEYNRVEVMMTPGKGFVSDMIFAVEKAGIKDEVFIIMADLPLVTPDIIDSIIEKHEEINTPALSVHMKLDVYTELGLRPDTVFHKNNGIIVPCGINILNVEKICEEQEDYNLILDHKQLALNVNTLEDLAVCGRMLGH